ncbi:hypothetical protein ABT381_18645 [Streptomyces sp. NPDC000151]|uniref:hypothetical protein n=1 Tax=Streptomyces sp. NPDC000151 TaxID=3154244 RepID=UPI0033198CEA
MQVLLHIVDGLPKIFIGPTPGDFMPHFEHPTETVFTWAAPPLKFGLGASPR